MNRAQTFHAEWQPRAVYAPVAGFLALPANQRRPALLLVLRHWLATTFHQPIDDLSDTAPLTTLGLDVSAAIELGIALARLLGMSVRAADLTMDLSLAGLVGLLLQQLAWWEDGEPEPARCAVGPTEPLVFEQEQRWQALLSAAQGTGLAALMVRLRGELHAGALADSLNELVRRSMPLPASAADERGGKAQPSAALVCLPLRLVDLRTVAPAAREAPWRALIDAELHRPIDLAAGALCRAVLIRTEEQEHILLVMLHESAAAQCPPAQLTRELATLYATWRRGLLGRQLPADHCGPFQALG